MPRIGLVNDIWSIGTDHVVRIPTEVEYGYTILAEAVAIPYAQSLGLSVPEIVMMDNDLDIVPVPFSVACRIHAETLGNMSGCLTWELFGSKWANVSCQLGQQLALLHQPLDTIIDPNGWLNSWWLDNPTEELVNCVDSGFVTGSEAKWVESFIERLSHAFSYDPLGPCDSGVFVHHDLHPWNIMVSQKDEPELAAIIDWGNACWGDPAVDFTGFPLWALPAMVDAYRKSGGTTDGGFEGRVLWMWLATALREPSFLDQKVYSRTWWRMPEDGIKELQFRLFLLPDQWRQWAV